MLSPSPSPYPLLNSVGLLWLGRYFLDFNVLSTATGSHQDKDDEEDAQEMYKQKQKE